MVGAAGLLVHRIPMLAAVHLGLMLRHFLAAIHRLMALG
jgi:hypothetical protein